MVAPWIKRRRSAEADLKAKAADDARAKVAAAAAQLAEEVAAQTAKKVAVKPKVAPKQRRTKKSSISEE